MRNPASQKADAMREADEVIFQTIRSNRASMGKKMLQPRKNRMLFVAAPAGLIVVALLSVTLLNRGKLHMFRHTVEAQPVAASTLPANTILEPPMQLGSAQQTAANASQQKTATQPASEQNEAVQPQVQAKMMHDQLNAPSKIPHDLRSKASDESTSSLNMGGANMGQGNNSAIGNIFKGQPSVTVAQPKTVAVSAGVAGGLLMQRTAPVYPQIAKAAHVSGTVVLKATISKTGVIEGLHVVSGPSMLTQAAVEAVRTWRYRPYNLNNGRWKLRRL